MSNEQETPTADPKKRRLTVFVGDDTYRAVRLEAARRGQTMQQTLLALLDTLRPA